MPPDRDELFEVLTETSNKELKSNALTHTMARIDLCMQAWLDIVGYQGRLELTVGKDGDDWHVTVRIHQKLLKKLDLFEEGCPPTTTDQVANELIDAALVALALFRRESAGIPS